VRNRDGFWLFACGAMPCRAGGLVVRPCMFGPWFLCKLRRSVRPCPVCSALPSRRTRSGADSLVAIATPGFFFARGTLPDALAPGTKRASQGLDASLQAYRALGGPRQTLGDRTKPIPLGGLLGREDPRPLHDCPHGAVARFGECGLSCGFHGALGTLHLCRSVLTSSTGATLGMRGWLDLPQQGRAPCKKRHAVLGALTLGVRRGWKPQRSTATCRL
jgi:hypothetical protein